ncbi:MAG: HEAT repeat domain-containing protein [Chloroflexota bacterium]
MNHKEAYEEQQILMWIEQLESRDRAQATKAIRALSAIGTPAIPFLIQALHDIDRWHNAVQTLITIGAPAVDPLIACLSVPVIDNFAFEALTRIGESAVLPLIQVLQSSHKAAQAWAALALGFIGDIRAIEALINALQDDNAAVRKEAKKALVRIKTNIHKS